MSFGNIASPSLSVGDAAVSILKDTTVINLHASGQISNTALTTAGVHLGNETTPGFARAVMTCAGGTSNDRCLIDFSYAGSTGAFARIEGVPVKSGTPELKIQTDGVVRATFTNTSLDLTNAFSCTGDLSAPNMMPRSELATTYQPLLSSVADGGVFHTVLGTTFSAQNKLKALSGTSGIKMTSVFDSLTVSLASLEGFLATVGHGQLTNSGGITAQSTTTWGSSFAAVTQFETTHVGINQASTSFAEVAVPSGGESVFLHYLAWTDGGSCDIFGKNASGEFWMNRVNMSQTSAGIAGNLFAGNTVKCVGSRLSAFTHIVFRAVTGVSRFLSINFHAFPHPVCSSSHSTTGDVLSDGRIKTERELVSGQQALDICSQINCYTYDRVDVNQRRVGCIADEVRDVMAAALPQVENVVGSTMASPGDMERGEFLTMDYSRLTSLLCGAVGELKKQVAELKAQVQQQQTVQTKRKKAA